MKIIRFKTLDSTNLYLHNLLEEGVDIVDKFIRIIKTQNIKNFRVSLIGYLIESIIISRKFIFITYLTA